LPAFPTLPKFPPPPNYVRWLLYPLIFVAGSVLVVVALCCIIAILAYPQLPSLEVLTDYQPKIPLRVYTADGFLIGEFGEERRALVRIQDIPAVMKQAILAAEDDRFYHHSGVDYMGVMRAAYANLSGGGKRQGASTITMQVARNFFLSSEKTLSRKVYEILLAYKIESSLSKDEIFQLYANQIFLGQRAYGFASAAQIYFGKPLKDINMAEAAMLAGLPKAPSKFNPVVNPKRAKQRQLYVLRRMHELGFANDAQLAEAQNQALAVKHDMNAFAVKADYVAEMARQMAFERFQDQIYSRGMRVITTILKADQEAAYASLRRGVIDYDRRHGYRGASAFVDISDIKSDQDEALEEALQDEIDSDDILAAVVLGANPKLVRAYLRGGEIVESTGDGLKFAQKMLDDKAPPNKRVRRGSIVHMQKDNKGHWQVTQLPEVEAALVAASSQDGAIRALVGGFDFNRNKFNHVTQAWRQPGSSFKPFIYSAALEKGFTPATVIDDAPLTISGGETGSQAWEPKNYDGKFDGPMSMRTALAKSKNLISVRILRSIGTQYAQDYITRFGFDAEKHPPYLTMALGAGSVTPWQQLTAYTVFANGGYRLQPYVVKQILDDKNNVLAQAEPVLAGDESLRVLDARNAYLMDSMMHDVVRRGTATRALQLKRGDIAGKTGTTNDYMDAWFCGYQPNIVGVAWIGFDQPKKLGNGETGGSAALPMWMGYMEKALKGLPESYREAPEGLVAVKVTQDPLHKTQRENETEFIYKESLPAAPPDLGDIPSLPALPTGPAPSPAKPVVPIVNNVDLKG